MEKPRELHPAKSPAGRLLLALAALSLLLPAAALGNPDVKSVNETRPASADGRISVQNVAGSVTVEGWDRNELSVTGTIEEECTLEITGSDDRIKVEVKWPERHRRRRDHHEGSNITVKVPQRSELTVSTVSADISVSGTRGDADLESVSGDVRIEGDSPEVEAQTVSGDLRVLVPCKQIRLESVSGDVLLDGPSGEAEISTVSGDVRVKGGDFKRFKASSVSGDVEFAGGIAPEARFDVSSHSGDVDLLIPGDTSADFSVETFSGDIESDFGGRVERTSRYTSEKEMSFTAGSGSARVELSSFSGDVQISKR